MIRYILLVPALLFSLSACMGGSGPAPVEFKGANPSDGAPYEKAETPLRLPQATDTDTSAALVPVDVQQAEELDNVNVEPEVTEQLTEAEEMAMLDIEPQSANAVDIDPIVDPEPTSEVTEVTYLPAQPPIPHIEQEIVPTGERPGSIKVATGDTLFSLSEKYQVALQPLIDLNQLQKPYDLNKGQTLKLPPPLHYKVQKGDTLYSISRRYNIHFLSLAGINGIEEPFIISPSSILVLPALAGNSEGQWQAAEQQVEPVSDKVDETTKPTPRAKPRPRPKVIKPAASSTFIWPLEGKVISRFGGKAGGMRNDGINIAAEADAEVKAAGAGTVIYSGSELKNYGRLILIRHNNGWVTAYAHNSSVKVLEGAKVTSGQVIALAGSSGSVDIPQLHFETRKGVKPVDPLKHLPKR